MIIDIPKTQIYKKQKVIEQRKYHIQNTNNFALYQNFRCFLSQPVKYFTIHLVIIISMASFYILTFLAQNSIKQINYVIIGIHCLVFALLIILSFKNPGILPKISQQYDVTSKIQIPFNEDCKPAANQIPNQYPLTVKSHFIKIKFCQQCLIYKPPRAVHCWTCNACIQKMDHHCSFIGNCVGKGNYHIFILFVLSLNALDLLVLSQLMILIVKQSKNDGNGIFMKPTIYLSIILLLFCLIVEIFVGSLMIYHFYLISNNLTTNQSCKGTWNMISGNPFKKIFCIKNIFNFIKGPSNLSKKQKQFNKHIQERNTKKQQILSSSSYQNQSSRYQNVNRTCQKFKNQNQSTKKIENTENQHVGL